MFECLNNLIITFFRNKMFNNFIAMTYIVIYNKIQRLVEESGPISVRMSSHFRLALFSVTKL